MLFEELEKINPMQFTLKRSWLGWTYLYTLKESSELWNPTKMCVDHFKTADEAIAASIKGMKNDLGV